MTAGQPNQTCSGFGVILMAVGGLFFLVIGFSTTGWFVTSLPDESGQGTKSALNVGLWEVCSCVQQHPNNISEFLTATRVFTILALMILIVANILISWTRYLGNSLTGFIQFSIMVMFVFAAVFLLVAVSVYGARVSKDTESAFNIGSLSYSYAFTILAMISCFGGSVMSFVEWRKTIP